MVGSQMGWEPIDDQPFMFILLPTIFAIFAPNLSTDSWEPNETGWKSSLNIFKCIFILLLAYLKIISDLVMN